MKRVFALVLLLCFLMGMGPAQRRVATCGPLCSQSRLDNYIIAHGPTLLQDPDNLQYVTRDSVERVSSIAPRYGSTAAFTQSTDANKFVLSRPDKIENLIINSEVLGSPTRATVSANSTTNPVDGATTADTCVEDASAATTHYCLDSANMVSGLTYRLSLYAKPKERTFLAVRFQAASGALNDDIYFNLSDCTVGTKGADIITATSVSAGNGWCKLEMTAISSATGTGYLSYQIADSISTYSYSGDGASGLYLFGRQLQRASMQPVYTTTTTVPVYGSLTGRRMLTADGINDTMASTSILSAVMTNSAGQFFIIYTPNIINVAQHLFQSRGGYMYYRIEAAGSLSRYLNYDGTSDVVSSPTIAAGTNYVAYGRHDDGNIYLALNSSTATTAASGNTSNVGTVLDLGSSDGTANYFNGQLGKIILFNKILPQPVVDTIARGESKFNLVGQ